MATTQEGICTQRASWKPHHLLRKCQDPISPLPGGESSCNVLTYPLSPDRESTLSLVSRWTWKWLMILLLSERKDEWLYHDCEVSSQVNNRTHSSREAFSACCLYNRHRSSNLYYLFYDGAETENKSPRGDIILATCINCSSGTNSSECLSVIVAKDIVQASSALHAQQWTRRWHIYMWLGMSAVLLTPIFSCKQKERITNFCSFQCRSMAQFLSLLRFSAWALSCGWLHALYI